MIHAAIITPLIFLCLATTQTRSDPASKEDLQDEYYTIGASYTDKFQPSDDRDAQAVLDSDKNENLMASIFLYRDKIRRNAISRKIWEKNDKIVDQLEGLHERRRRREWWISESDLPQYWAFTDLMYSLIYDENVVLSGYLYNFFYNELPKYINIAMVLTKDMYGMIATYNKVNYVHGSYGEFKYARKQQKKPFENMLRVWVRHNRELLEKDEPPPDIVKQNADALKKEQDDGGWHENRDQIELILIKKSIKFSRAVLKEFEKLNNNKPIEDILTENIKSCGLNENLADTYSSLARYIKNKYQYIAGILFKYSDGSDQWAAWMLSIAVLHPQEWPKVDEVFKKDQKGVSLSQFILQKIPNYKILAEAMALAVDSKFKPTVFTERPIDNRPLPSPPPPPPTPPPPS